MAVQPDAMGGIAGPRCPDHRRRWPITSCGRWRRIESRLSREHSRDGRAGPLPAEHRSTRYRRGGRTTNDCVANRCGRGIAGATGEDRRTAARRLGCMQCGLCAASCPLGDAMEFPPRKLILQAAAGNLDKVLGQPVAVDVRRLLHLLESLSARHRVDRRPLAGPARSGHAAGLPAARRTPGDVPEHLQVRQHAGQVAAAAPGLGQGPGRAGARPVEGAPAGRRAVAGRLLPVVLSAEPGRSPGPSPGS